MSEDASLTAQQALDVGAVLKSALHMQRLVNDVLDLAKLREGSLDILRAEVRPP